jgi:hypothetical protein
MDWWENNNKNMYNLYVDKYQKSINNAKQILLNDIKNLYPKLYLVSVSVDSYYVSYQNKVIGCFTNELKAKSFIGTGNYVIGEYSMEPEYYHIKIIETTNYTDINIDLLLNIDQDLDMKHFGEMIK